jgi:predicted metalloprotease with PDZ domain
MPATFMWARGHQDMPVTVTFNPPIEGWKVATQLVPTDGPYTFTAPSLDYFLDSPVELSDFSERSWAVESGGREFTIRLVVHHLGTEEDVDEYAEMAKAVVEKQIDVFGELPEFDYGTYTFICDYLPYADRDGMEHRNSTVVTHPQSLYETEFKPQLTTLAHEFLHAWNAERIRPKRSFDFEKTNMSFNLWFMEGFTSYYDSLIVRRAGQISVDEFIEEILRYLDPISNSPGRLYASPLGMSARAPFVDAATAVDPTNFANIHISYYAYGAALALALDLKLRSTFDDVSLDDFMREVWKTHGRTEANYETKDLVLALTRVTGDKDFASEFFKRFVFGQDLPDFETLLSSAGLLIKRANEGSASAGPVEFEFVGREALVANNTIVGTPLYEAGIDRGDRIIAIGRLEIGSQEQWDAAMERHEPGSTVLVRYIQREVEREAQLTLVEDNEILVAKFEDEDVPLRRSAQRFRDEWLGPDSETE